jgi:iduronate 2-sulfatase
MRPHLRLLSVSLSLLLSLSAAAAAPRPNILFLISDDMNCALGTYGHPIVQSPNLDRLAATGVRFDRAYCQFPLCNPSRASLLSGRWPATTQVLGNNTDARQKLAPFKLLPTLFKENGYTTARVGKILHGGMDIPALWDRAEEAGGRDPTENQFQKKAAAQRAKEARGEKLDPATENYLMSGRSTGREEDTGDYRKASLAAEWLREFARDPAKPFFLAVGFLKPHHPYVAPAKYFDLYDPKKITWPAEPPAHLAGVPAPALNPEPGSAAMPDAQRRAIMAGYYACISHVDAQVGRVLAALGELKLADNTVVVFLGDHGYHLGEHATPEGAMWHKMSLFDLSARAPLIIRAPGVAANGRASARPVMFMDLYPTLAELAGLAPPAALDGHSLVSLLKDPAAAWPHAAFTFLQSGKTRRGVAVSTERHRYVEWFHGEQGTQLYDSKIDPHEFTNLAADPAHAATVAELKQLLRAAPAHF